MSTLVPDICRRIAAGFPDGDPNLPAVDDTRQLAATDYYIDFNTGNDTNDGLTAGTPLLSWRGFEIIQGRLATTPNGVNVHILAGENAVDDPVDVITVLTNFTSVRVINENPAITSTLGTVVSFTPQAGDVPNQLDCGAAWNATGADFGVRLRIVGGPNDGATAVVGSVGPANAFVTTSAFLLATPAINTPPVIVTPIAGDTIAQETLTNLTIGSIFNVLETNSAGVAVTAVVTFENFAVNQGMRVGLSQTPTMFFQCVFTPGTSFGADTGYCIFRSCLLPAITFAANTSIHNFAAIVIEGGVSRQNRLECAGGTLGILLGALFEYLPAGGALAVTQNGFLFVDDLVILNALTGVANNALYVMSGSAASLDNLHGTGGAGVGVYVDDGVTVYVPNPANVTINGGGGDFQLGTIGNPRGFDEVTGLPTAAIVATWANLAVATPAGFGGAAINFTSRAQIVPGGAF